MGLLGGAGGLIELIVIAAFVFGGLFAIHTAWTGFKEHISAPYVEARNKFYEPQIAKAKGDLDLAVKANDSLRNDVEGPGGFRERVVKCETDSKTFKAEAARADERARVASRGQASIKAAAKRGEDAQLARVGNTPTAANCVEGFGSLGKNVLDVAKDQLPPPPTPEPARGSGVIRIK